MAGKNIFTLVTSGGCDCEERAKPMGDRLWWVEDYKHNHSHFHGGYQRSDYSRIWCKRCGHTWRTKAAYVEELYMTEPYLTPEKYTSEVIDELGGRRKIKYRLIK